MHAHKAHMSVRSQQGRPLTLYLHRAQSGSGVGMVPISWFCARLMETRWGNGPCSHDAGMVEVR